jgi:hypothetical protein
MVSDSRDAPLVDLPWPWAMADSMEDLARAPFFALAMAATRRGLKAGSGPPTAMDQYVFSDGDVMVYEARDLD